MTFFKRNLGVVLSITLLASLTFEAKALTIGDTVAGTVLSNGTLEPLNISMFSFAGVESRGIIEFDISSQVAPVASAILRIFGAAGTAAPPATNINIFGFTGNGSLEAGDINLGDGNQVASFLYDDDTDAIFNIDVTSFVNSRIGIDNIIGFNLRVGEADTFANFTGSEGGDEKGPKLILTAEQQSRIPEPSVLALFGAGLLMLGLVRRRR